jgi:hypothetical protein
LPTAQWGLVLQSQPAQLAVVLESKMVKLLAQEQLLAQAVALMKVQVEQ